MTYSAGGKIQASDYNTFATLAGGMNGIFADNYPGATTLPNAGFGYGRISNELNPRVPGAAVTEAAWTGLFQSMRLVGQHQGTVVVPPLPVANPAVGDKIIAYSGLSTLLATLNTNRFNIAPGQSTLTAGTNWVQPGAAKPWTNSLTFSYRVDFGNWNNARYFFNSGGTLNLNGSYAPVVTPEDHQWDTLLTAMSPLKFGALSTTPATAGNIGTGAGFYGLTTVYQSIYKKTYGAGYYYSNIYIQVDAKLAAAAGTNGLIDFVIALVDGDSYPNAKTGTTTYRIDNVKSSGAVVYPGPAVAVATVGANNGFTAT